MTTKTLIAHSLMTGAALLILSAQALAADAPVGTVTALKGNVVWHQAGQAVPAALNKGDKLFAGDEVSTESKAHVTIAFDGDAAVSLGEKGLLAIAADQKTLKVNEASFVAKGAVPVMETECGVVRVQKGLLAQARKDGGCAFYLHEGTATIKNNAGLTVLTAGQGTVVAGQGPASEVATWTEEQVKFMRAGLPQGAVPSLVVEPPKPKVVEKKEEKKEVTATPVETAPVAPVEAPVVEAPAVETETVEMPEPSLEPVMAEPVVEPVVESPVVDAPFDAPEATEETEILAPGVEAAPLPAPLPVDESSVDDSISEELEPEEEQLPDATAPF